MAPKSSRWSPQDSPAGPVAPSRYVRRLAAVPQLDAVHGVLREKTGDVAREPQAFDRGAAEGETAAQGRVLVLCVLQPVHIVPVDVETGHPGIRGQDVPLELGQEEEHPLVSMPSHYSHRARALPTPHPRKCRPYLFHHHQQYVWDSREHLCTMI